MQLLAGNTDAIRQAVFDVHVHIFKIDAPLEGARLNFAADLGEPVNDQVAFGISQYADFRQHGGMSNRTHDVMTIKALIKGNRRREGGYEGVGGFTEAATPHGRRLLAHLGLDVQD